MSPVTYKWTGQAMTPLIRFEDLCHRQFVIGEEYQLDRVEPRSTNSHNHFFAAVNECWRNLPDHLAKRFPSPTHLRKWALCRCGYAEERQIVCENEQQAAAAAATVRLFDEYAVIKITGNVVHAWKAQSQSGRAMGKETFGKSKNDVLDLLSSLIGVSRDELSEHAKKGSA